MSTSSARHAGPAGFAWPAPHAFAAAAFAGALLAGCTAPAGGAAGGGPPALYVANAGDGTISRLEARTGRPLGPPLPAGTAPVDVVPGPRGTLLVLSRSPTRSSDLAHVAPAGRRGSAWAARPLALESGAREVWLAGDAVSAGHQAVVAYRAPDPTTGRLGCRVALVDVLAGVVREPRAVGTCVAGSEITGLAFAGGPGGPVAYLGIWQPADLSSGETGPNRLVAVHAAAGAVLATQPLAGTPTSLILAPAPGRFGVRLYLLERLSSSDETFGGAYRGRLRGLNPTTLDVEREYALDSPAVGVAVAPDGDHAYVLTAQGYALTHVDLATGTQRPLASLSRIAVTLAVTDQRVYVPDPWGSQVWVFDRQRGRRVQVIHSGRHPVWVGQALPDAFRAAITPTSGL